MLDKNNLLDYLYVRREEEEEEKRRLWFIYTFYLFFSTCSKGWLDAIPANTILHVIHDPSLNYLFLQFLIFLLEQNVFLQDNLLALN